MRRGNKRVSGDNFLIMEVDNTASDIYNYMVVAAFNGYRIDTLDVPATVVMHYDPKIGTRINPARFRIGYFDIKTRRWKIVSTHPVVNRATHSVADITKQTGYFAILYAR